MFQSLASSLITFFAVLLFALVVLFLWSGSDGLQFERVAMEGDRSTQAVMEEFRRQALAAAESAMDQRVRDDPDPAPAAARGDGPPVVVWISIPGFRGDYLERSPTSFFDDLAANGGGTNKMRPNFPCLTFPAHATMATGTHVGTHGIVADRIRTAPGEVQVQPTDRSLLLAEPIWETATRQGITTLVHDWPLSQNQTGEHAAAGFLDGYDPELGDEARLERAFEAWKQLSAAAEDPAARVRLVMLKLNDILTAGLTQGPRDEATYSAVAATDKALAAFRDKLKAEWGELAPPEANLVFFITTDHGLAEIDKNVNLEHLLGPDLMANADVVAHDAIANLYFKDLPESEGEQKIFIDRFDAELSRRIYFRTLKREDLPDEWHYRHERIGDRVLVLKAGYAFADHRAEEPVFDPVEGPGFFGGFGYPVSESIRMSGQVILGGFPNSPLSGTLDEFDQLPFHATVCKMLGIEPAPGAHAEPLPVK